MGKKKPPIPEDLEPVVVVWHDAMGGDTGFASTKEEILRDTRPCLVATIGWLIGKTDDDLVLRQDFCDHPTVGGFRGDYQIPRNMIRKVVKLTCLSSSPRARRPKPSSTPSQPQRPSLPSTFSLAEGPNGRQKEAHQSPDP